jgi:hypothetical protein
MPSTFINKVTVESDRGASGGPDVGLFFRFFLEILVEREGRRGGAGLALL